MIEELKVEVQNEPIEEVIEEITEELVEEVVEEVEKAPVFETLEDYNKVIQSTSSKAKGELLKEIGLGSVAEIKTLIDKGNSVQALVDELAAVKLENEVFKAKEIEAANNRLLETLNIPAESGELFLELVNNDTSDVPREEKAIKIKEKLFNMFKNDIPEIKVGSPKTNSTEPTQEELLQKMTKL